MSSSKCEGDGMCLSEKAREKEREKEREKDRKKKEGKKACVISGM